MFEIGKNLKQLETQAKKADKYFQLKGEYRESSIGLAYYRLDGFSGELDRISEQENAQQNVLTGTSEQIEKQENLLRTLRNDILAKEKKT